MKKAEGIQRDMKQIMTAKKRAKRVRQDLQFEDI